MPGTKGKSGGARPGSGPKNPQYPVRTTVRLPRDLYDAWTAAANGKRGEKTRILERALTRELAHPTPKG